MTRQFSVLLIVAFLGALTAAVNAQPTQTEAAYVLPWNRIFASRLPSSFTSIVGDPGTTTLSGSTVASPFDPTLSLTLPFSFRFIDSTYPAGHTLKAGIAGFLSFNSSATVGTAPYVLRPDPVYNRLLMPFWGEWRTSGLPHQGIHHRIWIDPILQDTVWTIEWRVETAIPPHDDGAFQIQIIKSPPGTGGVHPRYEYRFAYDLSSTMATRSVPGAFGAQIGIKNLGQPIGCPPPPGTGSSDQDNYLIMARPVLPGVSSITRLRTRYQSSPYTPDWYAPWEAGYSSFFHFILPDSNFKMKPIDMDVESVLRLPLMASYVIPPGVPTIRFTRYTNLGSSTVYQVPVATCIFNGLQLVNSTSTFIDSLLPGQWKDVQFTIPSLQAGIYRVMGVANMQQDQNRTNDSSSRMLYVRPEVDVMPLDLLTPTLGPTSRYVVDSAIAIEATVAGIGTQSPTMLYHAFTILDGVSNVVASGIDSTQVQNLLPDSIVTITLGEWTPQLPGAYYVHVMVTAQGDLLQGNNILASIPSADWRAGGSAPFTPAPIPFRVFVANDLAAGSPTRYPHHPFPNRPVVNETPVRIFFRNNGGLDAAQVTGHVEIRDSAGGVVYDSTSAVVDIPGGGSIAELVFPSFTLPYTGHYSLRAWLEHSVDDTIRDNDTTVWLFIGVIDTIGQKRTLASAAGHRVRILPNPSSGAARLDVGVSDGPVRVTVTDALGAEVLRLERSGRESVIPLDMSEHPSGLYLVRVELEGRAPVILPLVVGR